MSVSSTKLNELFKETDNTLVTDNIKNPDSNKNELIQPASIYPDITREKWFWDKAVIS